MSTDVSEVRAVSIIRAMNKPCAKEYTTNHHFAQGSLIALMMEAARTSET
jgi:hypothetical protein